MGMAASSSCGGGLLAVRFRGSGGEHTFGHRELERIDPEAGSARNLDDREARFSAWRRKVATAIICLAASSRCGGGLLAVRFRRSGGKHAFGHRELERIDPEAGSA